MAWEERNGNRYYYRKMRRGKKVISEYIGTRETARIFADLDELERNRQAVAQSAWKRQKDDLRKMDSDLFQATVLIRNIVRANLLLAGFHPHKGQFRKRRNEEK